MSPASPGHRPRDERPARGTNIDHVHERQVRGCRLTLSFVVAVLTTALLRLRELYKYCRPDIVFSAQQYRRKAAMLQQDVAFLL